MTPSDLEDAIRIALHACCGPCLLEPLDALRTEGFEPVVVFANPNIQPLEEYVMRRDALQDYAEANGLQTVEIDVGEDAWREVTAGLNPPERCRACYALRLGLVARWANDQDIGLVATTLSVSPYQDAVAIAEEGRKAASAAGVGFLDRDYRERYPEATRRAREAGMYRQNYCGCLPSLAEARAEREARREARRRTRLGPG